MDTSDVLSKMGRDAPLPMLVDTREYGLWFRLMAPVTELSDEQIARRDIGQLDMESALGLPGAEGLTLDVIEGHCWKLNDWAEQVRHFTEKCQNMFKRRPWEFDNSPGQFRMLCLATYLYKHLGLRYNKAFTVGEYDGRDSRNLLIHGILSGHGGTCATMPILYIALGRRLGYPLKLVHAKEHFFVRWDEPAGERFNIEATSPGFNPRPDSYYRKWPKPIPDEEIEKGYYLRSLRPRQELASVLCQRTACLRDHLRLADAILSSFLAARLTENDEQEIAILGTWSVVTVMARALEGARKEAGLKSYDGLDLRKVRVPETKPPIGRWVAEEAREQFRRIAGNRERARDAALANAGAVVPKKAGNARPAHSLANASAGRGEPPVDMADTADVIAKMGYGWPGPVRISGGACDPWFRVMADAAVLPDEKLGSQDIGSLNFKAAVGLPGAESLRVDACVQTLNAWSSRVRAFTEEHWSQFARSPEAFNGSPACFRTAALVTVLQKHLGAHYDPRFAEGEYDATDSRDLFVHGLLSGRGGTCVTLPVLYVAVGRRLKYPLKLVRAKQHLFARWEGPDGERFNIECTAAGFIPLDDDHFRCRPMAITEEELQSGFYLRNLRPREELADFLCLRAECLIDNLRPVEALQSVFLAAQMVPDDVRLRSTWYAITLFARKLEQARVKAGQVGYAGLDLRKLCEPDSEGTAQPWAASFICEQLQRIARIKERRRQPEAFTFSPSLR